MVGYEDHKGESLNDLHVATSIHMENLFTRIFKGDFQKEQGSSFPF